MNYTQLLALCRLKVPAATSDIISDANALILMNNGILEITRVTKCLPVYIRFNTTVNMEYSLSTLITNYLCPLDEDLMHVYYSDDGSDYDELDIVTIGYLDENYSDWHSASAGDPERCVILGDTLYLHPKPASVVTNGVKFYYCKKPTAMDSATYIYPFGGAASLSRLEPFETLIIDYYEKEAYEILDINDPASARRSRATAKYYDKLTWATTEIKKNLTLMLLKSKEAKLEIPSSYADNPF